MLAVLMQTDTVERRRGSGNREKFHYYQPFVGQVCRPSFTSCLGVAPLTIQRYKTRVDVVWLVKWFQEFAGEVGEVVPVRVRLQKRKDGKVTKYYSRENYTMLPANFTSDVIYDEMYAFVSVNLRDLPCESC
ncbi:hypothetical protein PR003_g10601 [Phytophthora rubi]|uniref:Uncharacterized protein n=1 Tax=Phytophthora rubi TaxID=129364 RepID=A0A6A4FJA5_9STRA|nr:hypothetical protein PR003_g10601 [Phytophthora rubi]